MKAPLLYLSLFGLVWAQSELQPQYKKVKQKCMGEHQITVKGRNAKHGYYIFQYVYSSLMPDNQTWIKKEEDDNKTIYSGQHGPDKEKGPRKPIDNHTAEEKEEGHKNVAEMGNERESEDRRASESIQNLNERNESPSNRFVHQHRSEYILDKGRNNTAIDDPANDIDGSGDMGFLGQEERHLGTISGSEDQNQGKDHEDARGTGGNSLWGRSEAGQPGISNDTKLSKGTHIKTGAKENEASVIQEISLHSSIPKKSKESKSKDYLDVSVKVKNAASIEPGKEEGGSIDSPDKGREENASTSLQTHFNVQGKISGDLLGKMDRMRNGRNSTSFSDTDEIITVNEKNINYTRAHKKGGDKDVLNQKLDGLKVIYGETKPHQKGEATDNITSSKQTEVAYVMKSHKKDRVKDDTINGRSSSHIDVASISKTHRTGGGEHRADEGEHITGSSINQVENPIFSQPGQTNQSRTFSSGKLNGSGVTKSHKRSGGEVTLLGGTFVSQGSHSGAINQSQKGTSEVGIIHGKSNHGAGGLHFTQAHQSKAESQEKITRNAHESKQGDPERQGKGNRRLGVTFQEGNEEVVKGNIGYRKAPGTAGPGTDPSGRKEENSGHKSLGIKSALTLSHGSHNYRHAAKSQERSSYTLKNGRRLTEPSKKSSRVHNGRRSSSSTPQRSHGHWGVLQRKSSRHEKKGKSRKNVHASDSSQSSESAENSRYDSRRSYEDYQNDNPDSYQSAESAEENLSFGSDSRDYHSQMEEAYSREDSQERGRN